MDICPDVILTHFDTTFKSLWSLDLQDTYRNPTHKVNLTCDLFYNGMWQKPKKNTYWIHKNILLANVTRYVICSTHIYLQYNFYIPKHLTKYILKLIIN